MRWILLIGVVFMAGCLPDKQEGEVSQYLESCWVEIATAPDITFETGADDEDPLFVVGSNFDSVLVLSEESFPANIVFSIEGKEVTFTYTDGKFDIMYNLDDVTESAHVFLEAMKPYLNVYIKDKARLLNDRY